MIVPGRYGPSYSTVWRGMGETRGRTPPLLACPGEKRKMLVSWAAWAAEPIKTPANTPATTTMTRRIGNPLFLDDNQSPAIGLPQIKGKKFRNCRFQKASDSPPPARD